MSRRARSKQPTDVSRTRSRRPTDARRGRSKRPIDAGMPLPGHPYRDSAILYGVLSVCIVVVAVLTAGGVMRALVIAAAFFVVATAWSWWRFRGRLQRESRKR